MLKIKLKWKKNIQDPIALSDESVIEVLKRMHDELGSTENSGVKKAAEELTHFVDDFTK